MRLLGKIEAGGYLVTKEIQNTIRRYTDAEGNTLERVITEDMQAEELGNNGWKPVKQADESMLQCEDGYHVKIMPYDAGDCIRFAYIKKPDTQALRNEVAQLKEELTAGDYKVIKCYELSLTGEKMPYDVEALHAERQAIRSRINALEDKIKSLSELESAETKQ